MEGGQGMASPAWTCPLSYNFDALPASTWNWACRSVEESALTMSSCYNRRMLIGMLRPRCRWHLSDFSTSSHRAQSDSPPNCITLLYRDIKNHIVGKMQASWCRASCALSSCSKRPAIMSFFFKQSLNKLRCKSLMSVEVWLVKARNSCKRPSRSRWL